MSGRYFVPCGCALVPRRVFLIAPKRFDDGQGLLVHCGTPPGLNKACNRVRARCFCSLFDVLFLFSREHPPSGGAGGASLGDQEPLATTLSLSFWSDFSASKAACLPSLWQHTLKLLQLRRPLRSSGPASVFRTGRAHLDLRCRWRARAIARQPFKSLLVLTLRPPKLSRRSPEQPTEMTG
jgi:hypothetical protein